MNSGPQAMYMGKPVSSRMLSAVRRLWGQVETAATAVLDQSIERMNGAISPPPASGSAVPPCFITTIDDTSPSSPILSRNDGISHPGGAAALQVFPQAV